MNKLLSLVLSFCLLFSSMGGIAAPTGRAPSSTNSSDEDLIRLVMNYYDLLSGKAGSAESDEQDLTVEQDYQTFKLQYLSTLEKQCKNVNSQSEQGKQCANAKKEENIRAAYQTAISKQKEIAPNVALQSLSAELFHKLKADPLFANRFQKDGETLDPYLKIFPLFHLAQGLDDETLKGVEDVLQGKVKSNASKCADEDDTACPLGEAAALAMLSNRPADAQAVAEVFKKGYNHPQLGGIIVANLGGGLLAMSSQMGNYEAFSKAVVHIIEQSKSGNHTWSVSDFLSVEGWGNLVDRWFLEPGVFSEGFQYGFYKNEEDKEFSNWFSAWGDLGQELGRLAVAKKDSKAAAAANQIITAAHKKDKNHLMLLGMMTQGYYPAKSEEWLKEKAKNGMGDLDVPTRLYVREGIYDAYIGLGKSEQQANEDLHIYKRGTLEYNEYMLDAYNVGVTAEIIKIAGKIVDAVMLVAGIVSLASIGSLIRELWGLYRWRAPLKAFIVVGKSIKSAAYGKVASWAGKLGKFSKRARYAELSYTLRQGIVDDAIASIMTKREAYTAATNGYEAVHEGTIVARKTDTGVRLVRRSGNNERILDIPEKYQYSSIEDLEKGAKRFRKEAQAARKAGDYTKADQLEREATKIERLAKQADEFGLNPKEHFVTRPETPRQSPQNPSEVGINEQAVAATVLGRPTASDAVVVGASRPQNVVISGEAWPTLGRALRKSDFGTVKRIIVARPAGTSETTITPADLFDALVDAGKIDREGAKVWQILRKTSNIQEESVSKIFTGELKIVQDGAGKVRFLVKGRNPKQGEVVISYEGQQTEAALRQFQYYIARNETVMVRGRNVKLADELGKDRNFFTEAFGTVYASDTPASLSDPATKGKLLRMLFEDQQKYINEAISEGTNVFYSPVETGCPGEVKFKISKASSLERAERFPEIEWQPWDKNMTGLARNQKIPIPAARSAEATEQLLTGKSVDIAQTVFTPETAQTMRAWISSAARIKLNGPNNVISVKGRITWEELFVKRTASVQAHPHAHIVVEVQLNNGTTKLFNLPIELDRATIVNNEMAIRRMFANKPEGTTWNYLEDLDPTILKQWLVK